MTSKEKQDIKEMKKSGGWKIAIGLLEEKIRDISSINGARPEDVLPRQLAKELLLSWLEDIFSISIEPDPIYEEEKSIFTRVAE